MKQYEVEVMSRFSHGCYGKDHYFGLVLSASSCKAAETFAADILFDMTYQEFFERCTESYFAQYSRPEAVKESFLNVGVWTTNEDGTHNYNHYKRSLTDKIQNDYEFTFKSRVFKG